MAKPEPGRIVRIEIPDPQGQNPKRRPVVIVEASGTPILGIAISGQFGQADPDMIVELPFQAQGRCITKLKKRCAAICNWISNFAETDIVEYLGVVPTDRFKEIQKRIAGGATQEDEDGP